jgi:lactate permease
MTWTQHYTPVLDSIVASAFVAAVPVVVLLGLLALFRVRAHVAALSGLLVSLLIATLVYRMPIPLALASAAYGVAYGLFPIGWIVLCAIFVFDIAVKTKTFDVVRDSIAGVSGDRRIQTLLIAFCLGAFIEGAAGFGTPVAISAAMLMGLGFRPVQAAGLALIGNTAPVAFGALGTPITVLATVTSLPIDKLSATVGRQLVLFSVLIPFWLVWTMSGWKATRDVWPACLVAGLSFAVAQFLLSNFHGPWLAAVASAVVSLLSLVVLMKWWQPSHLWLFPDQSATPGISPPQHTRSEQVKAWMPWLILSILVFAWGLPAVKEFLNNIADLPSFTFSVPLLDRAVLRDVPIVPVARPEPALYAFNWLSATGTSLLITGLVSGLLLGLTPLDLLRTFWGTLRRVRLSLLTIGAMLGLGFTTRYAGLDATMGLAFTATGVFFPFFSPLLGWLGVALTGSDTSSNVLFGNLQQITSQSLGLSPLLAAAGNSAGGVMGKMIDAQSIVVASTATGFHGGEGSILRFVFRHSIVLACLVGLVVLFQQYVIPWSIP